MKLGVSGAQADATCAVKETTPVAEAIVVLIFHLEPFGQSFKATFEVAAQASVAASVVAASVVIDPVYEKLVGPSVAEPGA